MLDACAAYREAIDEHGAERVVAVLTSAVRDAANGAELERELRERFGFEAQTIPGEREARLTYLGATSGARARATRCWCSTSAAAAPSSSSGAASRVEFYVSTQVGSRALHRAPPAHRPADAGASWRSAARPCARRSSGPCRTTCARACGDGIAVAGTPTSFAAIDLGSIPTTASGSTATG